MGCCNVKGLWIERSNVGVGLQSFFGWNAAVHHLVRSALLANLEDVLAVELYLSRSRVCRTQQDPREGLAVPQLGCLDPKAGLETRFQFCILYYRARGLCTSSLAKFR